MRMIEITLLHLLRAVFTVELPPQNINNTKIPEFAYAVSAFEKNGGSFTGNELS